MRQRNPGPHPLILPTLDPPREVLEGEEIDHPELLAGFEPVDPAPTADEDVPGDQSAPEPADDAPETSAAKTKPARRGSRAADGAEEATTR